MSARLILVERLSSGRYRASRGNDWAEWDPSQEPPGRPSATAGKAFARDLRDLDLGFGCVSCGHLESEHHIDGEERAPCNDFHAPESSEAKTTPKPADPKGQP